MANAKNRTRRKWIGPTIAWGLFVVGCAGVVCAWWRDWSWGRNDWSTTQLDERGTFGDSFGMLSALFAGLALDGAFLAAYFQWVALRDERRSAEENAVESRFFQLVGSLQNTVNATRVGRYEGTVMSWLERRGVTELMQRLRCECPCSPKVRLFVL